MAIPRRAAIGEQWHCLSDDGTAVITAQRWTDPDAPAGRPRSWVRIVRNGRVSGERTAVGAAEHDQMAGFLEELAQRYAPRALDESQMWAKLREVAGVEQAACQVPDCPGGVIPVGSSVCPECRKDVRRVAQGSLSGVHRRGFISLPASRLRRDDCQQPDLTDS